MLATLCYSPGIAPSLHSCIAPPTQEDDAATQLESPFNDYSLQEVSFVLRFAYRPSDLTDRNLESVLTHLEGITRLANR